MTFKQRNILVRQFFDSLSFRSRLFFFSGVFCCFAPIGLLGDAVALGHETARDVVLRALLSGSIAVVYASVALYRRRWLPAAVLFNLLLMWAFHYAWPDPPVPTQLDAIDVLALRHRLNNLMGATVTSVVFAYVSFLIMIQREGRRFMGAHTEISLARQIHSALVPSLAGITTAVEWRGSSRPSGDVGGDLVDVVERDGVWFGCIADVTGHGVAAGVLMGMFKTALRANLHDARDLGDLVTRVNRTLGPLRQSHMLVTTACLRLAEPGLIEYVLAGHPPFLHIDGKTGRGRWVGESQLALGLLDTASYEHSTTTVEPGDVIVIVTDGLMEVFDRHDRELGLDGLRAAVEHAPASSSLAEIEYAIFDACRQHGAQLDDQTVLVMRIQ